MLIGCQGVQEGGGRLGIKGLRDSGVKGLRKRLLTSRSPGTRLRAHRAQRMGRGIQKGLRGSGVREEGWKVQGGRWPSVVTAVAGSRMCGRFLNWWPYFVPRWRDFEGFSLRSKIKVGLEGRGGGFRLRA